MFQVDRLHLVRKRGKGDVEGKEKTKRNKDSDMRQGGKEEGSVAFI